MARVEGARRSTVSDFAAVHLTLLSRAYCHLCDEMEAALRPILQGHGAALTVIDVDAHPALDARYGERVPVLFAGTVEAGTELCHYVLDRDAVLAAIRRSSLPGD